MIECDCAFTDFSEFNNVRAVGCARPSLPPPSKYHASRLGVHAAFGRLRLFVVTGTAFTVMHFAQRIAGGILEAHRSHTH